MMKCLSKTETLLISIFLSVTLHVMILLLSTLTFELTSTNLPDRYKSDFTDIKITLMAEEKQPEQTTRKSNKKRLLKEKIYSPDVGVIHAIKKHTLANRSNIENNHSALLRLLHEAIAAHEYYPLEGDGLTGKVRIQLRLSPNGQISHVRVLESSGSTLLDQAALKAIRKASPLKLVKRYLTKQSSFMIDIIYD